MALVSYDPKENWVGKSYSSITTALALALRHLDGGLTSRVLVVAAYATDRLKFVVRCSKALKSVHITFEGWDVATVTGEQFGINSAKLEQAETFLNIK